MHNEDFHRSRYTYEHIIDYHEQRDTITRRDAELIKEYVEEMKAKGKMKESRASRVTSALVQWRRFIATPYDEMSLQVLLKGITAMKMGRSHTGLPYKQSTQRQIIKIIKTFCVYLRKKNMIDIGRDDLDEITPPPEDFASIRPENILTDGQIDKLIGVCISMRDKCFMAVMYETAARVSEVASLTWNDLIFEPKKVKVIIRDSKHPEITRMAYVAVRMSYVKEHRKLCDGAAGGDFVFKQNNNEPISYHAVRQFIKRASLRSGVAFPRLAGAKLFRTSRVTNWLKEGKNEIAVKKVAWGSTTSTMLRHYEKLADRDVERLMLYSDGEEEPQTPVSEGARSVKCICGEPCAPGARFCPECGYPLTQEAVDRQELHISQAQKLPGYMEFEELKARIATMEKEIGLKK